MWSIREANNNYGIYVLDHCWNEAKDAHSMSMMVVVIIAGAARIPAKVASSH